MSSSEWPLITFTLCMQFSAGIVLLYNIFLIRPIAQKKEKIPYRYQMILSIALVAAITGVLFSLLHLGNPSNAIKSLLNIKESWLSREILFVMVYTGLLIVTTFLQFRFPGTVRTHKWILDLTSITGLILVFVMSRVYLIPAMPAWNSIFTPIGFFIAMMLSASSLLLLFQLNNGSWACQKALTMIIIVLPVIHIGLLPIHMSWLGEAGESTRQSLNLLLNQYLLAFYLRLGLEILTVGFGLWAFFSIRSDTTRKRNLFAPAVIAFATSVGAILIDRFLFYQHIVPIANL
jgi:anaerobic dimethyl sulfoxide reductase subunit C